jgi:hypothetical protein
MTARWIPLDPKQLDAKQEEASKGMHLEFSLSPYDIPQSVRGYYCEDRKRFVIEFKYITEETLNERKLAEHVSVQEGKNSGRMYKVFIDVEALNIGLISAAIRKAREAPSLSQDVRRRNLNSKLFQAVESDLMPTVAAAHVKLATAH